jgi:fumarate reductase flavoprotein subunit
MQKNSNATDRTLASDLVVVGGGAAGLACALAAAETGSARVTVLEKRSATGGNAARAWGLFAADSPVQKEALVDARCEDFFKYFMAWSHWKADPEITRAFVAKSGDTIRWLEKKGLKFNLVRYYPNQEPPVWHVPEGRGVRLVQLLADRCAEAGVRIFSDSPGKKILRDGTGTVTGVLAERKGQQFIVPAKTVVIASGGYGGNPELLKKFCRDYDARMQCLGIPHNGDGLMMALERGAATTDRGLLLTEWPHVNGDTSAVLSTLAREPYTVYVNQRGQRFVDEVQGLHAFQCANAISHQPDKAGYILADAAMIRKLEETGAILGRGNDREAYRRAMPGLSRQLDEAAVKNGGNTCVSGKWKEIAKWMDIPADALLTTVERYNSFCSRGHDEDFYKDRQYLLPLDQAPYYAIKGQLVFLHTQGGIKVNASMEVIDPAGNPLRGLYAAGADAGGWESDTYCDRFSGTALGFALNSGRIAGENAARNL